MNRFEINRELIRDFRTNVHAILMLPRTMENLTTELRRLNNNIEEFGPVLSGLGDLGEVMRDLRDMTAHLLGWRVK